MNITQDMLRDIKSQDFILNKHDIVIDGRVKSHWDVKVPDSGLEWRMTRNPVESDNITSVEVPISDPRRSEETGNVRIGSLDTKVTRMDVGKVQVVDTTVIFHGDHLRGAWITEQDPNIPNGKIFSRVSD